MRLGTRPVLKACLATVKVTVSGTSYLGSRYALVECVHIARECAETFLNRDGGRKLLLEIRKVASYTLMDLVLSTCVRVGICAWGLCNGLP